MLILASWVDELVVQTGLQTNWSGWSGFRGALDIYTLVLASPLSLV